MLSVTIAASARVGRAATSTSTSAALPAAGTRSSEKTMENNTNKASLLYKVNFHVAMLLIQFSLAICKRIQLIAIQSYYPFRTTFIVIYLGVGGILLV